MRVGVPPDVPSLAGPLGRIVASAEGRDYIARVPGAAQAPLSDDALGRSAQLAAARVQSRDTLPADFQAAARQPEVAQLACAGAGRSGQAAQ